MWRHTRPSNQPEARAVIEEHLEALRERGYDDLRALAGEVRATYLWGLLKVYDGSGGELSEVRGPSGALYHLVTNVSWAWQEVGRDLAIEVKIQEDAKPYGWLVVDFEMTPDGTLVRC